MELEKKKYELDFRLQSIAFSGRSPPWVIRGWLWVLEAGTKQGQRRLEWEDLWTPQKRESKGRVGS